MTATNIHYELAQRTQGLVYGGLGAIHLLAKKLGLIDAIDERLHLLKFHFPYHESDHVLTLAYNALCDGTCLQDLALRRTDEVFLNALGARRLPIPRPPATSAAASSAATSSRCSTSTMKFAFGSGRSNRIASSTRPSS